MTPWEIKLVVGGGILGGEGGGLWETFAWFVVVGYITTIKTTMCMYKEQDL
jgi:hypothetical protein